MPPPRLCAVCATPARAPFRAPAPELAPDLDMRPGEPTRSTLANWIATCPHCGTCAPDLTKLPASAAATIATDRYRHPSAPAVAHVFLRWAAICRDAGDLREAAEATLQAAWAADDAGEAAAALRLQVADLWGDPADIETGLRQVDVLRRAAAFDAAAGRAAALLAREPDDTARRILTFQQARIGQRDAGRHLISSALRPPSRSPHVAHGKGDAAGKGFWGRLLGRP